MKKGMDILRHIKQRAERDMEGAPQQKNMLSDSILGN